MIFQNFEYFFEKKFKTIFLVFYKYFNGKYKEKTVFKNIILIYFFKKTALFSDMCLNYRLWHGPLSLTIEIYFWWN